MEIQSPVKSIPKALHLLEAVIFAQAQDTPLSLRQMAELQGIPVNTAHNLLKSLEACGYVARRGRGVYVPGAKCLEMGRASLASLPSHRDSLMKTLGDFVEAEGEVIVCTILLQGERVMLARIDSNQTIHVASSTIEEGPFFSRPTGRILASTASAAQLDEIIERHGYPGKHWDGIADRDTLEKRLKALREAGVSVVTGKDIAAVACPVFALDGTPWGALGSYGPLFRCGPKRRKTLIASLQKTAETLARDIAWL